MASQIRAERLRKIRHGEELPQKKEHITFAHAWEKYLEWAKVNKKTYVSDVERYHLHIKPVLAEKSLKEITPLDIEKIKAEMTKLGRAAQTIKHVLAIIRRVFNKSAEWELFTGENPIKKVEIPSTLMNKRIRFLTHQEANLLLEETQKHSQQIYEICFLSLSTGMRAKEIFSLLWGDVDLEHKVIQVRGKMGIPQHAYITEALLDMFQTKERREAKDLVFPSRRGGEIRAISDTFDRVVARLGFNEGVSSTQQKVVFHTLRHTFASWLAIQGTLILTIKELMGHKSIDMTMRYAHLIPDQKRVAVQNMENIFKQNQNE